MFLPLPYRYHPSILLRKFSTPLILKKLQTHEACKNNKRTGLTNSEVPVRFALYESFIEQAKRTTAPPNSEWQFSSLPLGVS
ncbi:hypothetical protein B4168_3806 [Anoxybacillus flavithermus]|nr:hypothetical protein B4168_3806 [Anoxybacillus flavithermus]OAO88010.1 hypothetical protein GT23_0743 [Parageobacillus thermoglucosidasius]